MKSRSAPQTSPELKREMLDLYRQGVEEEQLIAAMRRSGLSIVPSIRLLSQVSGLPMNEAKAKVHFSSVWADCLSANTRLHKTLLKAMQQGCDPDNTEALSCMDGTVNR